MVWALIASLYIGNLLLLVLNLPLVGVWVQVLRIPRPYLYAGILLFAALGGYFLNGVTADLITLFAVGLLGWAMRRQLHDPCNCGRSRHLPTCAGATWGCPVRRGRSMNGRGSRYSVPRAAIHCMGCPVTSATRS